MQKQQQYLRGFHAGHAGTLFQSESILFMTALTPRTAPSHGAAAELPARLRNLARQTQRHPCPLFCETQSKTWSWGSPQVFSFLLHDSALVCSATSLIQLIYSYFLLFYGFLVFHRSIECSASKTYSHIVVQGNKQGTELLFGRPQRYPQEECMEVFCYVSRFWQPVCHQ